ncbi:purine transport regulator [Lentilactobacillus buchneri subsp. silagei]|uniref:PucR family transcriptional regulator n=1 Tax=Lentilactobacillus buchneri TaxID=1581 RepID=UPI0012E5688D|nr:PucR family transcriptional regulator [Lentilactobacillus buchneri]GED94176.1 purine transport regulator [Lentilactobacillus buchneri subsp. silagei]
MAVTLKDIQQIDSLTSAKLVAGNAGINKTVDNIMITEAPDVERWITPNEVLLASLYGFDKLSTDSIHDFMQSLNKHNCSGLIVKTSRFINDIPQQIIEDSNQFDIPLIEIPQDVKYSDIMLETMQLLFNERNRMLNRYKTINQQFIKLAIQNSSYQSIVTLLSTLVENPTYIFKIEDSNGVDIVHSKQAQYPIQSIDFSSRKLLPKTEYTNYQYFEVSLPEGYKFLMVKIANSQDDLYLGVLQEKRLQDIDFMAIENAVNFTQMEVIKQAALEQGLRTYANDIIDDLINGKITSEEEYQATLKHFKLMEDKDYRVTVIQVLVNGEIQTDYFRDNPRDANSVVAQFKTFWPDAVYRVRQNRIILIIDDEPTAKLQSNLRKVLQTLDASHPSMNFQIGLSENCHPKDFPSHASQALKTLQIAGHLNKSDQIFNYNDLGFYRFLFQVDDPTKLKSFVTEDLLKLYQDKPELYTTLKTYLDHNQNAKASADALFIHPKTMSYRLNKIQERTNINFSDVDEIFRLNVGIRVLNVLDEENN